MKYNLPCEVIQDLMPSYIDELTNEKSNEIIEEHLTHCEICSEILKSMKVPEPEVEALEKQDIDYLKKNRKKARQRVVLVSATAAVVVLVLVLYGIFFAEKLVTNADLVEASVAVDGNQITVEGNLKDTKRGVSEVSFYAEDGILHIELKETAKSSFHKNTFAEAYDWPEDWPYDITTIYMCDRVIWDRGVNISKEAAEAYEAKNSYVGDFPADGRVAEALGMQEDIGAFKNELQTDTLPYGWKIILEENVVSGVNQVVMERKMASYASGLIALIDNLGYVTFEYQSGDQNCVFTMDEEEADEWVGESVKALAETPKGLQNLMNILGLTDGRSGVQVQTYWKNEDGTWSCMGRTYKYRVVLIGKDPNAAGYGRNVVLTNNEAITYEEVSKSFYSSSSNDWLDPEEAVVVEMGVEN